MTKATAPEAPPFDPYDPAAIRRLAASVGMGECITFPNGLTIDKRMLANHQYHYTNPNPGITSWQPASWAAGTAPPATYGAVGNV